jgi:hypothetical protein
VGLEWFGEWKCACIKSEFGEKDTELEVSVQKAKAKTTYKGERLTYFAYEKGIVVGMEDRIVHDLKVDFSKTAAGAGMGMAGGAGRMGAGAGMPGAGMPGGGMPGAGMPGGGMPGMPGGMPAGEGMPGGAMGGAMGGMGMGMGAASSEVTGKYTVTYDTSLVK